VQHSLCGGPTFQPGTCMINVWICNLYDELALRGVTYNRNSCMMKQESWFLHKLYNENFLSDGHCITHKSGVQDASRRACLDAKQCLRSIHPKGGSNPFLSETKGRFTTWSLKRVSHCPSDYPLEGNIGASRQWDGTCPTITSLSTQQRVGVYTNLNLD